METDIASRAIVKQKMLLTSILYSIAVACIHENDPFGNEKLHNFIFDMKTKKKKNWGAALSFLFN